MGPPITGQYHKMWGGLIILCESIFFICFLMDTTHVCSCLSCGLNVGMLYTCRWVPPPICLAVISRVTRMLSKNYYYYSSASFPTFYVWSMFRMRRLNLSRSCASSPDNNISPTSRSWCYPTTSASVFLSFFSPHLHRHHSLAHMFYFSSQYTTILSCIFLDIFHSLFYLAWCLHSSILTSSFPPYPTSSLVLSSVPLSAYIIARSAITSTKCTIGTHLYCGDYLVEVVIWDLAFHALSLYIPTTLSQMCGSLLRKPFYSCIYLLFDRLKVLFLHSRVICRFIHCFFANAILVIFGGSVRSTRIETIVRFVNRQIVNIMPFIYSKCVTHLSHQIFMGQVYIASY